MILELVGCGRQASPGCQPLAPAPSGIHDGDTRQTSPSIHVEVHVVSFSKRDCHARWGLCVSYNLLKD